MSLSTFFLIILIDLLDFDSAAHFSRCLVALSTAHITRTLAALDHLSLARLAELNDLGHAHVGHVYLIVLLLEASISVALLNLRHVVWTARGATRQRELVFAIKDLCRLLSAILRTKRLGDVGLLRLDGRGQQALSRSPVEGCTCDVHLPEKLISGHRRRRQIRVANCWHVLFVLIFINGRLVQGIGVPHGIVLQLGLVEIGG